MPQPLDFNFTRVPLFVTSSTPIQAAMLEETANAAHDADECEPPHTLHRIDGDFTGWSIERLARYCIDHFTADDSDMASASFVVADDQTHRDATFFVVSIDPKSFEAGAQLKLDGDVRLAAESCAALPALFHQGVLGIGQFMDRPQVSD